MKHRKQLERRTFLQDRFEILIKKQKDGNATFAELTELDDIVNRSAVIRTQILEEMQGIHNSSDDGTIEELPVKFVTASPNVLEKIKLLLGKLFTLKFANRSSSFHFKSAGFAI
jgi:hypothetical protein